MRSNCDVAGFAWGFSGLRYDRGWKLVFSGKVIPVLPGYGIIRLDQGLDCPGR